MAATLDMTTGEPGPVMLRFTIPILLSSAIEMVYYTADAMVLGRLIGVNAFAAVSASGFIYWLVFCMQAGMIEAFRSVFSRRFGAMDLRGLSTALFSALWIAVVFGSLLSIGGVFSAEPLLKLLNTPAEILNDARIYLQIRFASMLIVFFGGTLKSLFLSVGNSRIPFIASTTSIIISLALNIFLVLTTSLGVAGVALSTAISQLFTFLFFLVYLRKASILHVEKSDLRPRPADLKELLIVGIPMAIRDLPAAIGTLVIQERVNGFGLAYAAGVAAAKQLYSVFFPVGESFSSAFTTFVGQNFGAKKNERVINGFRSAAITIFLSAVVLVAIMIPLRRISISLFIAGDSDVVLDAMVVGVRQLNIILICLPSYYLALLYRGGFNGIGNGFLPLVSGLLEAAARLVGIMILPMFFGEWGMYIAETLGWPVMAIQLMIAYRMKKTSLGGIVHAS